MTNITHDAARADLEWLKNEFTKRHFRGRPTAEAHALECLDRISELLSASEARERALREEVERCHKRLEIDGAWHVLDEGEPAWLSVLPEDRASIPDGIECRDDTIRLLEENRNALVAKRDSLRAALAEALGALDKVSRMRTVRGVNLFASAVHDKLKGMVESVDQ